MHKLNYSIPNDSLDKTDETNIVELMKTYHIVGGRTPDL
jgi:hypothetical protein